MSASDETVRGVVDSTTRSVSSRLARLWSRHEFNPQTVQETLVHYTLVTAVAVFLADNGEKLVRHGPDHGVSTERLWVNHVAVEFRPGDGFVDAVLQVAFIPAGLDAEVEERVIGRGRTAPDAVDDGLRGWWNGAVQTTLSALGGSRWMVGPLFTWQSMEGPLELHASGMAEVLTSLVPLDSSAHWIRYFVARLADRQLVADCYLDNEVWAEGRAALLQMGGPEFPWSVRQFLATGGR